MQRYVSVQYVFEIMYWMVQGWSLITGGLCVEVFEMSSTAFTVGTYFVPFN